MPHLKGKTAIVTGASSGFGEAIARNLAGHGVQLVLGARRIDRLETLAEEIRKGGSNVTALPLDVCEPAQVERFVNAAQKKLGAIDILINNAGLALGRHTVLEGREEDYLQMMNTNYMGAFRMTKAVLKIMIPKNQGDIVNIGSIAAHEAYEAGGGYCASKFALRALTRSLRLELIGTNLRVSLIDPGMAETEFSIVRFQGDKEKAKKVYDGLDPLTAQDIAECVEFVLTRPAHVHIDDILLTPLAQGSASKVHRRN